MATPILLILAFWIGPTPVTDAVVRRYFAARGVAAEAKITRVSRTRLVFDDVRLGPEPAPDFVARRITVDLGWSRLAPAIRAVCLDGASLRMRVDASGVGFGSLDKLIPPGRSTRFPAVRLDATGALVHVATPGGPVTWRVDGSGRLDQNFRATARLAPAIIQSGVSYLGF